MLRKPKFALGTLKELYGEDSSSGKATGMRQVLNLNELMNMSHKFKNLFKIQTFNGDQ